MRKSLLLLLFFPFMVLACAGTHASKQPPDVTQWTEKNAEFLDKLQERMHEEEEAFKVLSDKMDEYQTLMSACDRLPDTEENRDLKASCRERLAALKEELLKLTRFLQDKPE